jgi:hypothetical protein
MAIGTDTLDQIGGIIQEILQFFLALTQAVGSVLSTKMEPAYKQTSAATKNNRKHKPLRGKNVCEAEPSFLDEGK